jgi:hypothetical protein
MKMIFLKYVGKGKSTLNNERPAILAFYGMTSRPAAKQTWARGIFPWLFY